MEVYGGTSILLATIFGGNLLFVEEGRIKEGRGKAEALREAQLWLKDLSKRKEQSEMLADADDIHWVGTKPPDETTSDFSRPHYWAGFICSGVN